MSCTQMHTALSGGVRSKGQNSTQSSWTNVLSCGPYLMLIQSYDLFTCLFNRVLKCDFIILQTFPFDFTLKFHAFES